VIVLEVVVVILIEIVGEVIVLFIVEVVCCCCCLSFILWSFQSYCVDIFHGKNLICIVLFFGSFKCFCMLLNLIHSGYLCHLHLCLKSAVLYILTGVCFLCCLCYL